MLPLLAVLFVVGPIVELTVLIAVGRQIGIGWTIALVILVSVVGAWLARREGLTAWRRFQAALIEGRMPANEVADGAMILLAGALMLTPGFVSDVLALGLLTPPIRVVIRRVVVKAMVERSLRRAGLGGTGRPSGRRPRIIDGTAHTTPPGSDNGLGRSSTKVVWGEPERDWRRPEDQDPPPGR